MPCNMMSDMTSGDVAMSAADRANTRIDELTRRVAELEQALCGVCQMAGTDVPLHPQLQAWFDKHQRTPGCTVR